MKSLEPMYTARTEARARLECAAEAVERAKRLESAAAAHMQTLDKRGEEVEANNATELAVLIARGGPTVELPTMIDDDLTQALTAARRDHSVKTKALAQLEAIRAEAQTALAKAEAAVVQAVDAAHTRRVEDIAAQVEAKYGEIVQLVQQLRNLLPDWVNTSVNTVITHSPAVQRALSRIPPRDALHVPVRELQGNMTSDAVSDREKLAAYRAQMIAAEGETSEPSAA